MKILIPMSVIHYERFVARCDITSREFSILTRSLVRADRTNDRFVNTILCEIDEAVTLLRAAYLLYPEAVPTIKQGTDLASKN